MGLTRSGSAIYADDTLSDFSLRPQIAADPTSGGYVLAWTAYDRTTYEVEARRFDLSGAPIGRELLIDSSINYPSTNLAAGAIVAKSSGTLAVGVNYTTIYSPTPYSGYAPTAIYLIDGQDHPAVSVRISAAVGAPLDDFGDVTVIGDWFVSIGRQQSDARGPYGSYIQLFTETGAGITPASTGRLSDPTIAATSGGPGFLVAGTVPLSDGRDIMIQSFGASGTPSNSQVNVNSGNSAGDQYDPEMVALATGNFVLVWTDAVGDGSGSTVRARLYGADATALGSEFVIPALRSGDQYDGHVTALPDGGFVVAWTSGSRAEGQTVRAQQFDANGLALGDEIQVNPGGSGHYGPSIATLTDGSVAIAWTDESVTLDLSHDVRVQVFAPSVLRSGAEGSDLLLGRAGDDLLVGYAGDDVIDGGAGTDLLDGGLGRDIIGGKAGKDILAGGDGNDYLDGGADDDYLFGDAGEDLVIGGSGLDVLSGGEGSDVFLFTAGDGADIIADFVAGSQADAVALSGTGLTSFEDVMAHMSFYAAGNASYIQVGTDQLFFANVTPNQFDASDFIFV
jgi:Ca2+-binding RTX toxin-like protein